MMFLIGVVTSAQVGVSFGWTKYDAPAWNNRIAEHTILVDNSSLFRQDGLQIGIDYWFRLKNKRIEFLPEFSFYQLEVELKRQVSQFFRITNHLRANVIQFHFNTQIYPFDFSGDCNCPTFSNDGNFFKKGIFIRLAPGLSYGQFIDEISDVNLPGVERGSTFQNKIVPTLRAGIGMDIGLIDWLTLTPFVQYTHTFETGTFQFFGLPAPPDNALSEITQLHFGLRLGFRFDEIKN